jgi:MoaA/NifB/PqqE/SkfB family radical SAM enzyme
VNKALLLAKTLKAHLRLLTHGGPGFVQIALTNACNAQCRFCSFSQLEPRERVMADPERLLRGLHALAAAGVRYVVFTGGEPLLYPHLKDVLTEARDLGIHNLLCTNGLLLNRDWIATLEQAGVSHLIISIDAASEREHDGHRGFPGLCRAIRALLPHINRAGMQPVASVTISRLFSDFGGLGNFLAHLGFKLATFSYPLTNLHSSYLSYANHDTVTFSAAEMVDIFQRLKVWKSTAPVTVLNPSLGLTELQRQLCGRPLRFPCLAGYKYFYLDWHLNVYRCHYLQEVLGPVEDFATLPRERDDCHACLIDCYRDASVQQFLAVALGDAWGELRQGRWGQALGRLLHPDNVLSLGAILESRHWLGRNGH